MYGSLFWRKPVEKYQNATVTWVGKTEYSNKNDGLLSIFKYNVWTGTSRPVFDISETS